MGTAVISGSASGIGAATAERLRAQGYEIIGIDLKNAEIEADLSTADGRQRAIEAALDKSDGSIDRLLLAAGLGGHLDDGALVARVNYFGAVELLDGLEDAVAEAKGRAVVVSSNSAQMRTDPNTDFILSMLDGDEAKTMGLIGDLPAARTYGASKHAVARAVRRRAAQWGAKGMTLSAIAPGQTETPLYRGAADHPVIGKSVSAIPIPQQRVATADEMASIIEFMLSDAGSYIHGSVLYADGGTDALLRPDQF